QAGAGAVHRLQRETPLVGPAFALRRVNEVHVLLVVVPVSGAVPELLVEDLGSLDLEISAGPKLFSHLSLDQAQEHRSLRKPEGHPRRFLPKQEEIELRPELAVVALAGLLEA